MSLKHEAGAAIINCNTNWNKQGCGLESHAVPFFLLHFVSFFCFSLLLFDSLMRSFSCFLDLLHLSAMQEVNEFRKQGQVRWDHGFSSGFQFLAATFATLHTTHRRRICWGSISNVHPPNTHTNTCTNKHPLHTHTLAEKHKSPEWTSGRQKGWHVHILQVLTPQIAKKSVWNPTRSHQIMINPNGDSYLAFWVWTCRSRHMKHLVVNLGMSPFILSTQGVQTFT